MLQKEQKSGTCITSFNLTVNYSKLMTIIFFALIKQHDKWSYPPSPTFLNISHPFKCGSNGLVIKHWKTNSKVFDLHSNGCKVWKRFLRIFSLFAPIKIFEGLYKDLALKIFSLFFAIKKHPRSFKILLKVFNDVQMIFNFSKIFKLLQRPFKIFKIFTLGSSYQLGKTSGILPE